MERIIVSDMLDYLRLHNVIDRRQHGFLSRRSTSTNLLDSLNDWTLAIKNKKSVLVAYIDYAKAFDTVSHAKLFVYPVTYSPGSRFFYHIVRNKPKSAQLCLGSLISSAA
jgi:hypothetical protein